MHRANIPPKAVQSPRQPSPTSRLETLPAHFLRMRDPRTSPRNPFDRPRMAGGGSLAWPLWPMKKPERPEPRKKKLRKVEQAAPGGLVVQVCGAYLNPQQGGPSGTRWFSWLPIRTASEGPSSQRAVDRQPPGLGHQLPAVSGVFFCL